MTDPELGDFLETKIRDWHNCIGWSGKHSFSSLLSASRVLLHFSVPSNLNFSIVKSISNTLASSFSLGLPETGSIAFLHTSPSVSKSAHPNIIKFGNGQNSPLLEYFCYGRLFRDARLDYVIAKRLTKRSLLTISGSSCIDPNQSYINYTLATNFSTWSNELLFSSNGAMFGMRFCKKLNQSISAGAEVYYLANEISGGMSIGSKITLFPESAITVTINPLLGHFSSTATLMVHPGFELGAQLDYNVFSYESNVTIGLSHLQENEISPSRLQIRLGQSEGVGLVYQQRWARQILVGLGLILSSKQASIGLNLAFSPY